MMVLLIFTGDSGHMANVFFTALHGRERVKKVIDNFGDYSIFFNLNIFNFEHNWITLDDLFLSSWIQS